MDSPYYERLAMVSPLEGLGLERVFEVVRQLQRESATIDELESRCAEWQRRAAGTEARVRRLDEWRRSGAEEQACLAACWDPLRARIDAAEQRLEALQDRLESSDSTLQQLKTILGNRGISSMDGRIDTMSSRLDAVTASVQHLRRNLDRGGVDQRLDAVQTRVESLAASVLQQLRDVAVKVREQCGSQSPGGINYANRETARLLARLGGLEEQVDMWLQDVDMLKGVVAKVYQAQEEQSEQMARIAERLANLAESRHCSGFGDDDAGLRGPHSPDLERTLLPPPDERFHGSTADSGSASRAALVSRQREDDAGDRHRACPSQTPQQGLPATPDVDLIQTLEPGRALSPQRSATRREGSSPALAKAMTSDSLTHCTAGRALGPQRSALRREGSSPSRLKSMSSDSLTHCTSTQPPAGADHHERDSHVAAQATVKASDGGPSLRRTGSRSLRSSRNLRVSTLNSVQPEDDEGQLDEEEEVFSPAPKWRRRAAEARRAVTPTSSSTGAEDLALRVHQALRHFQASQESITALQRELQHPKGPHDGDVPQIAMPHDAEISDLLVEVRNTEFETASKDTDATLDQLRALRELVERLFKAKVAARRMAKWAKQLRASQRRHTGCDSGGAAQRLAETEADLAELREELRGCLEDGLAALQLQVERQVMANRGGAVNDAEPPE